MNEDYQRLKLSVVTKDDKQYDFITEADSILDTVWRYDLDAKENLTVYNDNGSKIYFPIMSYKFFLIPFYKSLSQTCKVIKKENNIIEVNDYIKA